MRSSVLALVTLAAGCGMTPSVRGSVRGVGRSPDGSAPPVAGARVSLECVGRDSLEIGLSDVSGRFAREFAEPVSNACWIVTAKEGLAPEKVRVLDACAYSVTGSSCVAVVVTAHLSPRQTP